jgi:hypothetical protein
MLVVYIYIYIYILSLFFFFSFLCIHMFVLVMDSGERTVRDVQTSGRNTS